MDDFKIWSGYWTVLEPFLMRVAVNFPHCLDYVARIVAWRYRRFSIDEARWAKVCQSIIDYNAPRGNDSEVVWSCWLLSEIGAGLNAASCEKIIQRCGPFSILIIIDLFADNLINGRFPKQSIIDRLGDSPMLGNDWLVSYEAERSFGFRLRGKNRNDYSVIGTLIDDDVSFYDSNAIPIVFQNVDDIDDVDEALEDHIGLYEEDEDDTFDSAIDEFL
ncbi:hypothetical protein [Aquisalinus flavus]|nr:hypothetical protein [Aquisalinus flavus]MBD0425558.1 hypothetical protein [Aquisalinus flavus]UNE48816.1 hypothetical protein FF099_12535 [Aquisalinus flavus]